MELGRIDRNFPQQRVPYSEKQKAEWYANSIDYIIDMGLSCNDRNDTERKLDILHGNIPNEFYKKTLNPYNSNNEKYTRFPATMRNLDIMSDIIRRYVSEYFKGIHEFIVSASNPEIVIKKSAKLREEIGIMASQAFQQEFERRLQQMQAEAAQQGVPPEQINPQEAMPNPEEFMQNFNEKYIDDESKQGQDVLNFVRSITSDIMIYLSAFFDYVSIGECYTYSDIRGEKVVKEHIPVIDAFPIPNGEFFVEDHDMFARRHLMSYPQILDMFDDVLTKEDRAYLEKYYDYSSASGPTQLMYSKFFEYYPDVCEKFTKQERELYRLLITVSGVGANTARMILSSLSPVELCTVISSGNDKMLKSVKGIGLKTAQRIIVDLKDKIISLGIATELPSNAGHATAIINNDVKDEAVAALTMLGFSPAPSAKVVTAILTDSPDMPVEQVVKLALKQIK